MSKQVEVNSGGVGFCGLLVLLFIGLKLTGHITWSWWWVFAPVWIPILMTLLIVGGVLTTALIMDWKGKR
jgi:predicted tellurium resistance membrane protein TerC